MDGKFRAQIEQQRREGAKLRHLNPVKKESLMCFVNFVVDLLTPIPLPIIPMTATRPRQNPPRKLRPAAGHPAEFPDPLHDASAPRKRRFRVA
jgi:hypothetical protein